MNNDSVQQVPYIVHEADMARQERTIKRLWILCILMFISLVASNIGWIMYESQFEETTTTQEVEQNVDTENGSAVVNGIGNIYGTDKAESKDSY